MVGGCHSHRHGLTSSPTCPGSVRATGGYFTQRPACKNSVPRSAMQGGGGVPKQRDVGRPGVVASTPSPSPALPVPTVLSTAGRALEAARGGAERVRLRPGVCHCPPGALQAGGAARCHAGRSCLDPPTSPTWGPARSILGCSREGPTGAGTGLTALWGSGMLPRGMQAVLWEFPTRFPPRRWMVTSTSGCGSTCRQPAGRRWRPAELRGTGSRALQRHPHG